MKLLTLLILVLFGAILTLSSLTHRWPEEVYEIKIFCSKLTLNTGARESHEQLHVEARFWNLRGIQYQDRWKFSGWLCVILPWGFDLYAVVGVSMAFTFLEFHLKMQIMDKINCKLMQTHFHCTFSLHIVALKNEIGRKKCEILTQKKYKSTTGTNPTVL